MTRPLTQREADAMRYTSAVRSTLQRAIRALGARTLDQAIQIHNQPTEEQQ